jgi:hypothetical protein
MKIGIDKTQMGKYFILISILVVIVSCDNTFEPLSEEGTSHSFYGFLDFDADTNFIRVNNLKKPLLEGDSSTFNGTAVLEHIESGTAVQLVDSMIIFNEVSTFNFMSTLQVLPENTYRLTVTNSEGRSTSVTHTAISRYQELKYQPLLVEQRTCTRIFTLTFSPIYSGAIILNVHPRSGQNEYTFTAIEPHRVFRNSITFSLRFTDIGIAVSLGDGLYCPNKFEPIVRFEYIHVSEELIPDAYASRKFEIGSTGRFGTLYSGEFELEFNF